MKSWPSRSATTGTKSWPGRTDRESIDAPSTTTSGPSRRPPTAAARSEQRICMARQSRRRRRRPPRTLRPWPLPTASASSCCSAGSRPSTRCRACRRSTCCGPPIPDRYALDPVGITREGQWVRADDARRALAAGAGRCSRSPPAATPHRHRHRRRARWPPCARRRHGRPARRGAPPAPRHQGRGRHGAGDARAGRRALRRLRRARLGALHGQAQGQGRAGRHGLPQAPWVGLRDTELDQCAARGRRRRPRLPAVREAGQPRLVGRRVSKVADADELAPALQLAATYDEWIVVEEGVTGREIEVAVLGNAEPRASLPGEILPTHDFYDYEDKYLDGAAEQRIPADLPDEVTERDPAPRRAGRSPSLRCDGMARVDFFYDGRRARPARQRDQHDPRLHADLDVPEDVGGHRPALPRAGRRARAPRPRAPRAPQPLLHQALVSSDRYGPARPGGAPSSSSRRRTSEARRRPPRRRRAAPRPLWPCR